MDKLQIPQKLLKVTRKCGFYTKIHGKDVLCIPVSKIVDLIK